MSPSMSISKTTTPVDVDTEMEEKRQCNFFVKKRKRFCRLIPGKGKKFCGEHINFEKNDSGNEGQTDQPSTGRVPCPYDSHHTVAVKQLAKHLKVCNSRPKEQPIYYQKGVNAGLTEHDEDLEALRLASFSLGEIQQIISKVESVYADHVCDIETQILHHDVLKAELDSPENGASARKHLLQLASLLGHMNRLDLLQPNTCFVEFGAGKGRLSQWIQQAMNDLDQTSFLLIDRAPCRHKRDAFYQRDDGGPRYERISMDIENLVLGKVPTVCNHGNTPVVAYTKHLCGAATDLALRCLMETRTGKEQSLLHSSSDKPVKPDEPIGKENSQSPEHVTLQTSSISLSSSTPLSHSDGSHKDNYLLSEKGPTDVQSSPNDPINHEEISDEISSAHQRVIQSSKTSQGVSSNLVKGVVMALCCHHRCSWRTHVGKQFFRDVGISEREFMALVRMSSWAVCGTRAIKKEEKDVEEVKNSEIGKKVEALTFEQNGDGGNGTTKKGPGSEKQEDRIKKERIGGENPDFPQEQETIVSSLGLSVPEREKIGFKCKRILDMGRLIYLKNLGLHAKLVYYVERNISPENAVIIATPLNQ